MAEGAHAFARYAADLEAKMRGLLATSREASLDPLYGMLRYHMGWVDQDFVPQRTYAGKQIRPVLLLLVCEALGGDWRAALPAAAGIEYVHNFSLIHDDIEDNSTTRRGRATLWHLWGIPQAINAGDLLMSHAYSAILCLHEFGFPPSTVQTATNILSSTTIALCQGQYLDLAFESAADVDVSLYLQMIENKTAALMAGAAEMGALLAGAEAQQQERYRRFGRRLGLGFQIMDDILGIWGSSEITGKPVCDDLRMRKKTLPVIHAMDAERAWGESTLADLYAGSTIGDEDVSRMLEVLEAAGSQSCAREMITQHRSFALEALDATGIHNEAQGALVSILDSALERQF